MIEAAGRKSTGLAVGRSWRELNRPLAEAVDELTAGTGGERTVEEVAEELRTLARLGVGSLRIPAEHGGAGLTQPQFYDAVIDLAAAESNIPHILIQHWSAVEIQLALGAGGNIDLLRAAAAGTIFGTAITEAHDNVLGEMRTRVTEAPDGGFRLNGRKEYTTGSYYADLLTVICADENGTLMRATVPTHAEGVTHVGNWSGIGQRESASGSIIFEEVEVDARFVAVLERKLSHPPDHQQLMIVATLAGIARAAALQATVLLRARRRIYSIGSGGLPREDPQIQEIVGDVWAQVDAARAVVLDTAAEMEAWLERAPAENLDDPDVREQAIAADVAVLRAQAIVSRIALGVTSQVFDALGGSAIAGEVELDRHWRNARTLASHNPIAYKLRQVGDYHLNGTEPRQVIDTPTFTGVLAEEEIQVG
ncbi:MAG: acyl-CoA dehydrogenase family protein [Solirubrobacterales bacterium]